MTTGERFAKRFIVWLSLLGLFLMAGWAASPWIGIGFNITDSVSGVVFLILKKEVPVKGELAAFYPPPNDFYKRHYFVKYVSGVAGDQVIRRGASFYINDGIRETYVGDAKPRSRSGVALQASTGGLIPDGFVYVSTPHKDSFDSRYQQIGWISEASIMGRAIRLL